MRRFAQSIDGAARVVGGYIRSGARGFAAPVDQVLGEQLGGLKAYLER